MFTDILGCAPDASKEIIQQKFDHLLTTAILVKDKEILRFLKGCAAKFVKLIAQKEDKGT